MMIEFIAVTLFIVLSAIALVHVHWGSGGLWPCKDLQTLVNTVIGTKGMTRMPPTGLTLGVAILIGCAGLFPLLSVYAPDDILPFNLVTFGMVVLALIFIGRGIASFSGLFRRMQASEPFVTLDRKYYGPLCLIIGVGFVAVLSARMSV